MKSNKQRKIVRLSHDIYSAIKDVARTADFDLTTTQAVELAILNGLDALRADISERRAKLMPALAA